MVLVVQNPVLRAPVGCHFRIDVLIPSVDRYCDRANVVPAHAEQTDPSRDATGPHFWDLRWLDRGWRAGAIEYSDSTGRIQRTVAVAD